MFLVVYKVGISIVIKKFMDIFNCLNLFNIQCHCCENINNIKVETNQQFARQETVHGNLNSIFKKRGRGY